MDRLDHVQQRQWFRCSPLAQLFKLPVTRWARAHLGQNACAWPADDGVCAERVAVVARATKFSELAARLAAPARAHVLPVAGKFVAEALLAARLPGAATCDAGASAGPAVAREETAIGAPGIVAAEGPAVVRAARQSPRTAALHTQSTSECAHEWWATRASSAKPGAPTCFGDCCNPWTRMRPKLCSVLLQHQCDWSASEVVGRS